MRLRRGTFVLAIVTALWGAPSLLSAAETTQPGDDPAATGEMIADILLLGVAGVASVAIVGTLLLVAGREREPARAEARRAPSLAADAPGRRMGRTGRAQPGDDPIIAALGVDDEMAARREIRRAGQASRVEGPGQGAKAR